MVAAATGHGARSPQIRPDLPGEPHLQAVNQMLMTGEYFRIEVQRGLKPDHGMTVVALCLFPAAAVIKVTATITSWSAGARPGRSWSPGCRRTPVSGCCCSKPGRPRARSRLRRREHTVPALLLHSGDQFTASTSMSAMKPPSSGAARLMFQGLSATAARLPHRPRRTPSPFRSVARQEGDYLQPSSIRTSRTCDHRTQTRRGRAL